MVVALMLAIPSPTLNRVGDGAIAPAIDMLAMDDWAIDQLAITKDEWNGSVIVPEANTSGMWPVVDDRNETIALVARTLPAAEDAVGYRGPTEASIVLTPDLTIASVAVLSSADTSEHVEAVRLDEPFLSQFRGWSWGNPPNSKIDAVSGATLTSMALAEGVLARIGTSRPSLVFPNALTLDEIKDWFPEASNMDDLGTIRDETGAQLGRVIRSGPLSDDVVGYQGPTELLIKMDPTNEVSAVRIRQSFDNEPYVGYVRQERGYWALFRGMTLQQLAEFSPADEGVEGVSGATMTSLAVADTLVATAQADTIRPTESESAPNNLLENVRFTAADIGTVVTLLALLVTRRFKRFRRGFLRQCWLVTVVVVIGLWSGNLLSLALISGWSAEGIAWRLAPALTIIFVVAMLAPPLTKNNPYCSHVCPHGAIQQLVIPKQKPKHRIRLPKWMNRWLVHIPAVMLTIAYVALVVTPSIDLSAWEPFHAYLFRVAGWGSVVFALLTLLIASRIPMAYCRFGCSTGYLLDYLRRNARSHRLQKSDFVAIGLLAFSLLWRQLN
ncbi:MAG: FMN-binding protein [Planctomycetota bacterium]